MACQRLNALDEIGHSKFKPGGNNKALLSGKTGPCGKAPS
jgi:hypothetical protein